MKLRTRLLVSIFVLASMMVGASAAESVDSEPLDASPAVDRWWGANRYLTAVDVSQANFPSGADAVIVATGLNFPDALAAAGLAKGKNAPVLLVPGGKVGGSTLAEVRRLNPSQIFILGGTAAVTESVENVLENVAPVIRLAGANRYLTAIEISRLVHQGSVDTVYLASGASFPDPLFMGPVAASNGDALLLVRPTSVSGSLVAELKRLSPSRIVVVGGGGAVSQSVVIQLADYASEVVSITGATRYNTGALVSNAGFPDGAGTVLIATGELFPDALSGGGVAGKLNAPVLLVKKDSLPTAVAAELVRLVPTVVHVLGGSAAISDSVVAQISATVGGAVIPLPPPSVDPDVFTIGDSVMQAVACNPEMSCPAVNLEDEIPNLHSNALVNRQFPTGKTILSDWLAAGNSPDIVVLHLGTNGPPTSSQFAGFMAVAKDIARVLIVTIKQNNTTWETSSNELFHAEVPKYDNAELVHWYDVATSQLDMDAIDPAYGAHLWSAEAREVYVDMIVDAVTGP